MPLRAASALPTEVIDHILGFHATPRMDLPTLEPSGTLVSCLSTSRQLRACALRYLFAEIAVPLNRPARLKLLRDCIVSGELSPYIKSVGVFWQLNRRYSDANVAPDDATATPLLDVLIGQSSLRRLIIHGSGAHDPDFARSWNVVPEGIRRSLAALSHIRSIDSLHIVGFKDIPPELFPPHTAKIDMVSSSVAEWTNTVGTNLTLGATTLRLQPLRIGNHHFPKVQHLDTLYSRREEYNRCWEIISDSRNALEIVRIEVEAWPRTPSLPILFPQDLNIAMLPKLQEFSYKHYGESWQGTTPILSDVLPFFIIPDTHPGLRVLTLSFDLDAHPTIGDAYRFWKRRSRTVATDPSWAELDAILTKGTFPSLRNVRVRLILSMRFSVDEEEMTDEEINGIQEEVEGALLQTFSASLKAYRIRMEISVETIPQDRIR